MLQELKQKLLEDSQNIVTLLEHYGFAHIKVTTKEIRCGFDSEHNPNSIQIRLTNNDKLFVVDYGNSKVYDIFTYIIKMKNISFKEVIAYVKNLLNIDDYYYYDDDEKPKGVFGGFFDRIHKNNKEYPVYKIYPNTILNNYQPYPNIRFWQDHINIEAQKYFNIMYDVNSQRIIIPIYDYCGNIIGIKGRANWEIDKYTPKYMYLIPCRVGLTLYGYAQNYKYLTNNTVYIVESEKAVMQAYSYGMRNFVALMGNTLHNYQCKLLAELNPTSIVFMLDEGLDFNITHKNINKLISYVRLMDTHIGYWNYSITKNIPAKSSPCDLGHDKLMDIINNDIEWVR